MGLEHRAIPLDFVGKEDTRVLRIHLKGFTYVRPTHGTRREWQLSPFGGEGEGFDERFEQNNEEKRSKQTEQSVGGDFHVL